MTLSFKISTKNPNWWFYLVIVLGSVVPVIVLISLISSGFSAALITIIALVAVLTTTIPVIFTARILLTSAEKYRQALEKIQSNLEEQNVELVRNTLSMTEYRNQLEDRH